MKKCLAAALIMLALHASAQKFENLALTPPMGWNTWNTFQTRINEQLVKETADYFVSSGMRDAGYTYIVLDDGWSTRRRDSITRNLVADPKKFPSGMKALADYVHSKGLKFGLYGCGGKRTCADYPGSHGYEEQDAKLFASWGIDYLKYDWCYSEGLDVRESYTKMSEALRKAGRPIVFSICEWGSNQPWFWAKNIGHLWRTTGDIGNVFDGLKKYPTWSSNGVMTIVDLQEHTYPYAGPGNWNDPDMLEVGNGQTQSEDRSHFSLWCMMAAPLMAGNDITKMSKETLDILTNKDAIAVDQDRLGIQGFRFKVRDSVQVWFRPLANDEWAVCFVNRSSDTKEVSLDWSKELVRYPVSGKPLNAHKIEYTLYNIWTKQMEGTTAKPFTATLASHDVIFMRMKKK